MTSPDPINDVQRNNRQTVRCDIPASTQTRKNWQVNYRRTVNAIVITRCVWADIPKEYGSKSTAHRRFQDWWEMEVWQKMLRAAIKQATQDQHAKNQLPRR